MRLMTVIRIVESRIANTALIRDIGSWMEASDLSRGGIWFGNFWPTGFGPLVRVMDPFLENAIEMDTA